MPEKRGFFRRHKWLILRRLSQLLILSLFLAGPYAGIYWIRGDLASSEILDMLSLSDPLIVLQSLVAGHEVATVALLGALTVLVFYSIFGGRSFCAWVCPINPVTDAANSLRDKLGIKTNLRLSRTVRYSLLVMILIVSAVTGVIAWEVVNPITMLHRGLIYGLGMGWVLVALVFLFDLLVIKHGWCGHICPVGAFYGLINRISLVKVNAAARKDCTDCGDCFHVCPEPHVIAPALYPDDQTVSPVIQSADCINCGKCIDVCAPKVFNMSHRFASVDVGGAD